MAHVSPARATMPPVASSPPHRAATLWLRRVVRCAAAAVVLTLAVGCGGENPFQQAATTSIVATEPGPTGTGDDANPFLPERDLGDCIGTVQRPGCGSDARGGWRQYLVMLVLVAGVAFIGWRIARGVRARDRALDGEDAPPTR